MSHLIRYISPLLLAACLVFSFFIDKALSQPRHALLIGNSDYGFAPLRNPLNDVRDLSRELKKVGFQVTRLENLDLKGMQHELKRFSKKASIESSVILFYYAGHAVQYGGKNYLVPIGFSASTESSVLTQTVCLDDILSGLENKRDNTNIIILDACRTNPFDVSDAKYSGEARSVRAITVKMRAQGLVPMKGTMGTFIAFSTSPGKPAADGQSRNGLYTKHLLHYLSSPSHTIEEVFKKVRVAVLEESNREQIPWERSSLLQDFYFIPPTKEVLTHKTVRDLIQESRVDIAGKRYGMAYKRLKLANKMAATTKEVDDVQLLMKKIKDELGVE